MVEKTGGARDHIGLIRILVAFDGSPAASSSLEFAISLSRRYGSDLILCTVLDRERERELSAMPDVVYPSGAETLAKDENEAAALLQKASMRARAAGARATTVLLDGRPASAIVACAKERDAGAVVLGTRGKDFVERAFTRSTANGVLRLADVPVFVVRETENALSNASDRSTERILVAIDESDAATAAFAFALKLTSVEQSVLLCCSAVDTGQLVDNASIYGCDPAPFVGEARDATLRLVDKITSEAGTASRRVERLVLEGPAADAILAAADRQHAGLIVCGTHGRRGVQRFFLGSVAESVVRRSTVPVAVVRR